MRILALIADRVLPAVSGTRVRNLHLWPAVARQGHDVRLLGLDLQRDPDSPAQGPPGLNAEFIRPARLNLIRRAVGAATRSHHQWPPAPEFADAVDRAIDEWRPDVVHAEELRMAAFLPRSRGRPCAAIQTLTLHNVESDLIRKTGSTAMPFARRLFAAMQYASLDRFERRAVHSVDVAIAFSETDLARYRQLYPLANWSVTRNGAAAKGVVPVNPQAEKRVLLPGSLAYAPNVRGLEWFIEQILPRLADDIELTVAGSRTSDAMKQRVCKTRMKFIDTPPDLAPLYASHGIAAIPLLEGSGTRGRILESLSFGRLVVTTSKGAEGLDLSEEMGVITVDDPGRFAEAIEKWVSPSREREIRVARGRQHVERYYDWSVVAPEFVSALKARAAELRR